MFVNFCICFRRRGGSEIGAEVSSDDFYLKSLDLWPNVYIYFVYFSFYFLKIQLFYIAWRTGQGLYQLLTMVDAGDYLMTIYICNMVFLTSMLSAHIRMFEGVYAKCDLLYF